jgi:tetratricopeptide (TPR) repeat protein
MKITYTFSLLIFSIFLLDSCGGDKAPAADKEPAKDTVTNTTSDTLKKLNDAIAADPHSADALYQRAKYYLQKKDYHGSYTDMMQVLSIDSSKAPYFLTLADVYFFTNKTSGSKRALEKAVALDDKNVDALLKLAELFLYVSKSDKSIEYINKALKIDQYNAKAYFMKGMNYKDLKDTARAISSMQTAVEQDQNYYHAYMQLGILWAAKKNPVAIQYYKNAIRIVPNSTEAWYAIGKFYQDSGDWENAITTYKALIAARSHNKYASYNLGVIYLVNLKKYQLALEHFTEAVQQDPNYTEAYYGRGVTYHALKDDKQAMDNYQQCLRINPDYKPAQMELKQLNKLK